MLKAVFYTRANTISWNSIREAVFCTEEITRFLSFFNFYLFTSKNLTNCTFIAKETYFLIIEPHSGEVTFKVRQRSDSSFLVFCIGNVCFFLIIQILLPPLNISLRDKNTFKIGSRRLTIMLCISGKCSCFVFVVDWWRYLYLCR